MDKITADNFNQDVLRKAIKTGIYSEARRTKESREDHQKTDQRLEGKARIMAQAILQDLPEEIINAAIAGIHYMPVYSGSSDSRLTAKVMEILSEWIESNEMSAKFSYMDANVTLSVCWASIVEDLLEAQEEP